MRGGVLFPPPPKKDPHTHTSQVHETDGEERRHDNRINCSWKFFTDKKVFYV